MRRSAMSDRPDHGALIDEYLRDLNGEIAHTGVDYREFLRFLDRQLCPNNYFEIGTHQGDSVQAVNCDVLCIDPNFLIDRNVVNKRSRTFLFQMTSDDFFNSHDPRDFLGKIDLGFLDGLHRFENLLRDFINFERHSHPGSMALLHDCLPLNTRMAERIQNTGPDSEPPETQSFWTGDVWRVLAILREYRPDLDITVLDCPPTGLVLCSGLNNRSTTLMYSYDKIIAKYAALDLESYSLRRLWGTFPILNSRAILANPRVFCERYMFRR